MSADDSPFVRLTNAVLLGAIKKRARYCAIAPHRIYVFHGGTWQLELDVAPDIYPYVIRRLCVMMGSLAPGPLDESPCSALTLELGDGRRQSFAVVVERVAIGRRAFIELVTEDEIVARHQSMGRVAPIFPTGQPIPGFTQPTSPYRGSLLE